MGLGRGVLDRLFPVAKESAGARCEFRAGNPADAEAWRRPPEAAEILGARLTPQEASISNILYDTRFAPLADGEHNLIALADGRGISAVVFREMLARAANALRSPEIRPGDRVAVQIAKTPEALAVCAGTVAAGAVFFAAQHRLCPGRDWLSPGDARPECVSGLLTDAGDPPRNCTSWFLTGDLATRRAR